MRVLLTAIALASAAAPAHAAACGGEGGSSCTASAPTRDQVLLQVSRPVGVSRADDAAAALLDSGGAQEESSWERPELGSDDDEEMAEYEVPEDGHADKDAAGDEDIVELQVGGASEDPWTDRKACQQASGGPGACGKAQQQADKDIKMALEAATRRDEVRKQRGIDASVDSNVVMTHDALPRGPGASVGEPPPNIRRAGTHFGECPCGTGYDNVRFWINDDVSTGVLVNSSSVRWLKLDQDVKKISFWCNALNRARDTHVYIKNGDWISMQVFPAQEIGRCKWRTNLKWNSWKSTDYVSSVPFTTTTDGYNCFKIPAMMVTQLGTFIAFSEARKPDCSDFAETDLVYKRSTDGGLTWGPLKLLVNVSADDRSKLGVCGKPLVIGNTAPVQVRSDFGSNPGRILAPYTRNNLEHWIVYSEDDGETFVGDAAIPGAQNIGPEPLCDRNMSDLGFEVDKLDIRNAKSFVDFASHLCHKQDPYQHFRDVLTGPWQFVGAGPPGSLQTTSGRILVPSYHSYIRGIEGDGVLPISQLYNNLALGHVLISDDGGNTWSMSDNWQVGNGANENQMVQLGDGSILTNMRSLSTGSKQFRLQSRSTDNGVSFGPSEFVDEIQEPFGGCQGSTMHGADRDTVFVSSPDPPPAKSIIQRVASMINCNGNFTGRRAVTVWKSTDAGRTYPTKVLLDEGLSAQTSLQWFNGRLFVLYEQADREPKSFGTYFKNMALGDMSILLPSRMIFREVLI